MARPVTTFCKKHNVGKLINNKGHYHCRICEKERTDKYLINHPDRRKITKRKTLLKNTYGISLEEYNNLIIKQNNKCAICGKEPNGRPLCIDHNHITNTIRGLLCDSCNFALGLLKDDPILCTNASEYLKRNNV